jgi:medium-chain acyl-[acyl-carrier-protein] hydrolase
MAEPLCDDVVALMNNSYDELQPLLNKPFAFFGHSMGALVSYEFARRLQREERVGPVQLIVSGCMGPHLKSTDEPTYNLPEPEFIAELRRLQGTPAEVLDNSELMQLMMPIIRADFKASQTYEYVAGPPLQCPISAFGGLDDEMVTREKVEGWSRHTQSACRVRMLPGDHFFPNSSQPLLTGIIGRELIALLETGFRRTVSLGHD